MRSQLYCCSLLGAAAARCLLLLLLLLMVQVVCELPLDFSGPSSPDNSLQDLELLQSMSHSLSVIITDASLSKDVTALQEHLQSLADAAGHTQQLTEDAVDQLVLQVCRLSLQQLPPLPEPLAEAAAAAAAAAGGGGGGAGSSDTAAGRRSRSGTAAGKAAGAAAPGRKRASAAAAKAASKRAAASSSSSDASDDSSSGEASDGSSGSDHEEARRQAHAVPAGAGRKVSAAGPSRAGVGSRARTSAAAMHVDDSDSDTDGDAAADGNSAARPVCDAPGRAASEDDGSTGSSDGLDSDSDGDEDGRVSRRSSAAAGVGASAGKARVQGHKAAAGVSGAQRQPLAPSNMVNRSGRQ